MEKPIYNDMAQRVYSIALYGQLFILLRSKAQTLAKYGFEKMEDQILLVFLLLRVLMEKTLRDEDCTLDDIALELMEMDRDIFHLFLEYEQCRKLALVLIDSVLSNNGEPMEFNFFPEAEYFSPIYIRYLTSRVIDSQTVSYRMDDDGFHLMLSTLEMEQNMQLQFRDMVFQLQLKKQNYSQAYDEIRHIFDLLKMKEIELKEKIVQVRKNALDIDIKQYNALLKDNFEVINNSSAHFSHYQQEVEGQIKKIQKGLQGSQIDPSQMENLYTLRQIKQLLYQATDVLTSILKVLTDFSQIFNDEVLLQVQASSRQRYDLSRLVFDPVLKDPSLLERIDVFLKPLFIKQPDHQFQLSHVFEYKRLLTREENEASLEIEDEYDEASFEREKERLQLQKQTLNHSVFLLLSTLLDTPEKTITLQQFGQPQDFLPSMNLAKQLFISWMNVEWFPFETLEQDRNDLVWEANLPYTFPLSMLEMVMRLPELRQYQGLCISKDQGQVQYSLQEEGMRVSISLDNLRFTLVPLPTLKGFSQ
ncbi:MAG: hypothetical protein K2H85_06775 [Allobaculum sp.]|nr:hypothetical protein [Allobaculum sp.]